MFLKPGVKDANEIEMVAPTGFEPVLGRRADRSVVAGRH
jgi:hypothetical protein